MKYRVSSVCAFHEWERDPDATVEELIEKITGAFAPSPAMLAGTAFHKVLENAVGGICLDSAEELGHRFVFPADLQVEVAPIRELRASKTYTVDGVPIIISGQVDAIDGLRIEDHKTTAYFNPDRYLDGYQWRIYLDIFGASLFRWNVFEITQVDSTGPSDGFDAPAPEYEVRSLHRLEQYRYPALEADCLAVVTRFARFVREHIEREETAAVLALPQAA